MTEFSPRVQAIKNLHGRGCPHLPSIEYMMIDQKTGEQDGPFTGPAQAVGCAICVSDEERAVDMEDKLLGLKNANDLLQEQLDTANEQIARQDRALNQHDQLLESILKRLNR